MATEFNKGDRVSYNGHLGTVVRVEEPLPIHVAKAAVVVVEMDDPGVLLSTGNPVRVHAGDLEPVSEPGFAMAKELGADGESWLRKRVEELEKQKQEAVEARTDAVLDLEQARRVIQGLLIAFTWNELPTADAAAVRQAVMFLGGTSE